MQSILSLSFRSKVSILVFLVSFTFFMGFILLEDLLILKPLLPDVDGWDGTRRLVRLGFGFFFSILTAVITSISFQFFYANLKNLIHFIQSWREEGNRDDIQITRNDEIGNLVRSLQIAIFQEEERSEKKAQKTVFLEKSKLTNQIQERFQPIALQKIPGYDISIFPKSNRKPSQDLLHILKTNDGCVGMIAGFDSAGVRENSFKHSIHSLFRFLARLNTRNGYEIFQSLRTYFEPDPHHIMNWSGFFLETNTGELNYQSYQEIPPVVWNEHGIRELDKPPGKHVPPQGIDPDESKHAVVYEKEWLFLFSDRILKTIQLTGEQFLKELDLRVFQVDSIQSNTRDIVLSIAQHISKRYGKKALVRLGIIAIKRN